MDNLNKLQRNQDEYIKKVFQTDTIVNEKVIKNFATYIEKSNIKLQRFFKIFVKTLILLLLLLIIYNNI